MFGPRGAGAGEPRVLDLGQKHSSPGLGEVVGAAHVLEVSNRLALVDAAPEPPDQPQRALGIAPPEAITKRLQQQPVHVTHRSGEV